METGHVAQGHSDQAGPYSSRFQGQDFGASWDAEVYRPGSWDSFIWELQREVLLGVAGELRAALGRPLRYLDFACGSGRVLCTLEPFAERSVGIDISDDMLAAARKKVRQATLVRGDFVANPKLVEGTFDLITSFRFFLNTEPEMRRAVLARLAERLDGPRARLVFNVHGNSTSVLGLRGLVPFAGGKANTMAVPEMRQLIDDAGLEIEAWYGHGLVPRRLHVGPLASITRVIDRLAAHPGQRWMRALSRDILFVCRRR